jgi:hypothetical protein
MSTPTSPADLYRDGRFTSYRDYWNPSAVSRPGADFTESNR